MGGGEEIHCEPGAQLRVAQFLQGTRQRVAGAADDDAEAAEPGDRIIQYRTQRTGAGDVHAHSAQTPGKDGGQRLQRLVIARARDHSLTRTQNLTDQGLTPPPGRAGDQPHTGTHASHLPHDPNKRTNLVRFCESRGGGQKLSTYG